MERWKNSEMERRKDVKTERRKDKKDGNMENMNSNTSLNSPFLIQNFIFKGDRSRWVGMTVLYSGSNCSDLYSCACNLGWIDGSKFLVDPSW